MSLKNTHCCAWNNKQNLICFPLRLSIDPLTVSGVSCGGGRVGGRHFSLWWVNPPLGCDGLDLGLCPYRQ